MSSKTGRTVPLPHTLSSARTRVGLSRESSRWQLPTSTPRVVSSGEEVTDSRDCYHPKNPQGSDPSRRIPTDAVVKVDLASEAIYCKGGKDLEAWSNPWRKEGMGC